MYWTEFDGGNIERANFDGTGQQALLTGLASRVGPREHPV
jgi:hypothetical protein